MITPIFIGVHGSVFALDYATGRTIWTTALKGSDFVTILVDGARILAATKGEVFCLDAATGHLLWRNDLPGQGWGVITIATATASSGMLPAAEQKRRQDRESANSAAG
ncbi:MAG TPA: PQQ-binding-like beta-propeller repeat protein [Bryobacteraceae bacterium]|jgi:outer membrane protein assembly factor BamB